MTAIAPYNERLDNVLLAYWLEGGSATRASEATGIPKTTIQRWVKDNPERLRELREKHQPAFDQTVVARAEQIQIQALETMAQLVEKVDKDLRANRLRNPDQAAQRLATVFGIITDKSQLIQGKPTHIVDNGDAAQKMRSLQQRFPWLVIDSTAEEEPASEPEPQR